MRIPLPLIFITIVGIYYLTLPSEVVTIKNEETIRMYRLTIAQLERQMGDLAIRLREKDSELTETKARCL